MSAPRCLVRLDGAEPTRALATAEALALGARPGPAEALFACDALPDPGRGAYLLGGGEVIARGPAGGPLSPVIQDAREVHVVRGPWKASGNPIELLARIGWRARYQGPGQAGYQLFAAASGWWLVRAPAPAPWTEPALVHRTSTSLPSRVARAVVNLVARPGERVLDPVCGTGVLLVEAARVGCAVTGGDLSPKAVGSARANLRALSLPGVVDVRDALTRGGDPPYDALVGDLPYGVRLAEQDLGPFLAALPRLARRWALVAHRDLGPALTAAGFAPRFVLPVPKSTFTRYVHGGGEAMSS